MAADSREVEQPGLAGPDRVLERAEAWQVMRDGVLEREARFPRASPARSDASRRTGMPAAKRQRATSASNRG